MKHLKIYLSGSVRKGTNDKRKKLCLWTKSNELEIVSNLADCHLTIFNPNLERKRNVEQIFQDDMANVRSADITLVDLTQRRGLGVGVEMYEAQLHRKMVIGICPKGTYYNPDGINIHPFVNNLCDFITNDRREATELIYKFSRNKIQKTLFFKNASM